MIATSTATRQNEVVSDEAEAIPPITPGHEAAGIGDSRDAGDAARRMRADTTGGREDERHDDREADSEQREGGQADGRIRREHDCHGSGCRTRAGQPYRGNRPQPPDHAIAQEPDRRHRHSERRHRKRRRRRRASELVPDVDRRPVESGLLGKDRAETDQSDDQHRSRRQGERRRSGPFAGALVVEQELRSDRPKRGQNQRLDRELGERVEAGMRCQRRQGRTEQHAEAPEAVEARHHRLADRPLDEHTLRVHRHVREPRRRAEDEQNDAEQRKRARQRRQNQTDAPGDDRRGDERAERVAMGEATRERHRQQRADSGHQQREPEVAHAHTHVRSDPRNPGSEAPHHAPVHREHHRSRASRASHPRARDRRGNHGHTTRLSPPRSPAHLGDDVTRVTDYSRTKLLAARTHSDVDAYSRQACLLVPLPRTPTREARRFATIFGMAAFPRCAAVLRTINGAAHGRGRFPVLP